MTNSANPQSTRFSWFKALFYLFLGLLGLLIIVGVIIYFALISPAKAFVADKPFPLEHMPVSKPAETAVVQKLRQFAKSDTSDSVIFNSGEINHLIRTNARIKAAKIKYKVALEDSLFNVRCVVHTNTVTGPLKKFIDMLGISGYINAEVEGYLRMREGKLTLITTRAQINGQPAPFTLLGKRTHIDLADFFKDNKKYHKMVDKLKNINIKNRKMIVTRK